jgi:hypothetical protein
MKAKILVYALPALILATIHLADAQQPAQVHRVGFLAGGSLARNEAFIEAFRQNLRELGYRVPRVGGKGGPFSSTRGRAGASQGSPYRSLDYTSCPGCEKCDPDNTNCNGRRRRSSGDWAGRQLGPAECEPHRIDYFLTGA